MGQDDKTRRPMKTRAAAATLVALSPLCAYSGLSALNAAAATATLPVIAKLVRAIEITVSTSLDFGTLAMTVERAGQATIDPSVDKLFIQGNSSLALAGGEPRAGRLQIRGAELPVSVSVEDSVVKLTNGTSTVSITNLNLRSLDGGRSLTVTPQGTDMVTTVAVGGTLNTQPAQLSGTYAGTTRIFANYQ